MALTALQGYETAPNHYFFKSTKWKNKDTQAPLTLTDPGRNGRVEPGWAEVGMGVKAERPCLGHTWSALSAQCPSMRLGLHTRLPDSGWGEQLLGCLVSLSGEDLLRMFSWRYIHHQW